MKYDAIWRKFFHPWQSCKNNHFWKARPFHYRRIFFNSYETVYLFDNGIAFSGDVKFRSLSVSLQQNKLKRSSLTNINSLL